MRIALDAMGSDRAPLVEVEGAIAALPKLDGQTRILLVGDEACIRQKLDAFPEAAGRIEIHHAPDRIEMGEAPAQAIRRKPASSISVGLNLLKQGKAGAFISAGSTGAVMAGSQIILRPLPGVDRPAVGAVLPTATGLALLLDAGANVDMRPHHLLQFAHLGSIYAEDSMGKAAPRVGLLNIGEEPEKGNELSVEAYRLLSESEHLNFIGNVEGRDIIHGACDVLICDGFVGNVLLKFYESVSSFIVGMLEKEVESSVADIDLNRVFRALDYTEYGGAPLLGVNGVVIICHGGSPPRAVTNAICMAEQAASHQLVDHIRARLPRLASHSAAQ